MKRPDAPATKPIAATLGKAFRSVQSSAEPGWLAYHAQYAQDAGGYEGLARVTVKGGQMAQDGTHLRVTNAEEILIVLRITPLTDGAESKQKSVRKELSSLSKNYDTLLAPHAKTHGEMFRRVTLDLGASAQWTNTPTEKMLADAHAHGATPLFLEHMFTMGRYLLISSSGKYPPPIAGNLGRRLASGVDWLICFSIPTSTSPFRRFPSAILPNAPNLISVTSSTSCPRGGSMPAAISAVAGFLVSHYSDPEYGFLSHFGDGYPWMFWPGGAGWNLRPFYEHALVMGDVNFMKKRVLPLYREMAEFYEDYLELGADGFYHVSPGISPENSFQGNSTMLARDCTIDIAVAREVFAALVQMGRQFKLNNAEIAKWQNYHDRLVPYRINEDGALAEWIPASFKDNYAHRHTSHLYPIYPGTEFLQPGANPALLQAAHVALDKRFATDTDSAHGLIHVALMAARVHDPAKVVINLDRFSRRNYVYAGLCTSHYPNHSIFNLDSALSLQRLIMETVVISLPGRIELLPSLPPTYPDGKLTGVRVMGGHKLDITWAGGKLVSAVLHAGKDENCEILYGSKAKTVSLKAGKIYAFDGPLNPQ